MIKINIVADTFVKGFGAYTAYTNNMESAKGFKNIALFPNKFLNNGMDMVHVHGVSVYGLKHVLSRERPVIFSYHLTPFEARFIHFNSIIQRMINTFIKRSSCIVAPSPFCRNLIKKHTDKPVAIISNGVQVKKFKIDKKKGKLFREEFGIGDKPIVFSVGMPIEKKGLSEFVRLADKFKGVSFVWVGRNFPHLKDRTPVEKLRKKYPNVIFTGRIQDITSIYSAGDILIFPSIHEIQGIPILEAAACKKPIVVRDISAYHHWLYHNKNCLKFKNRADDCIRKLLEDKNLRRRLVNNAYRTAKMHDISVIRKSYKKLYESCAAGDFEAVDKINSSFLDKK